MGSFCWMVGRMVGWLVGWSDGWLLEKSVEKCGNGLRPCAKRRRLNRSLLCYCACSIITQLHLT
jgi:hypothetical protein